MNPQMPQLVENLLEGSKRGDFRWIKYAFPEGFVTEFQGLAVRVTKAPGLIGTRLKIDILKNGEVLDSAFDSDLGGSQWLPSPLKNLWAAISGDDSQVVDAMTTLLDLTASKK